MSEEIEFKLIQGNILDFENALYSLVVDKPMLLASVKKEMESLGFIWQGGKLRDEISKMSSVSVALDSRNPPVAFLVRRDKTDDESYLQLNSLFNSACCSANPHKEGKKFKVLYFRYKEQKSDVFAHFPIWNGDWDGAFRKLADMALQEIWESPSRPVGNVDILKNYLNYTFLRLQDEGKILYSENGKKACFNTGLQTRNHNKDIIATFVKNEKGLPTWYFKEFVDIHNMDRRGYPPGKDPEVAEYYNKVADLFFDLDYKLMWNAEHIVEHNKERLPKELQECSVKLASVAIGGALDRVKAKVKRNYKLAIPHWYKGHVQLLLPLNLTGDDSVSLALVADKDEEHKCYRITTILTPEMAYVDARLICRPDSEWLQIKREEKIDSLADKDDCKDSDSEEGGGDGFRSKGELGDAHRDDALE